MKPIEKGDGPVEPEWDNFGIRRTDFRPHWKGDLVNVFSIVEPQESEEVTADFMRHCARKLAAWVLANRKKFGKKDRFQVVVGWSKSVREHGTQIIKTGGTYDELQKIASGETPVEPMKSWSVGVFKTGDREQIGAFISPGNNCRK